MPRYVLPKSGTVTVAGAPAAFYGHDPFTRAFIEALFWTESDKDDIPADAGYADLSSSALDAIRADCARFQKENEPYLAQAYARPGYDEARAGHDFWLTRNGHGTGFWDRDELDAGDLGAKLASFCGFGTDFDQMDAYMGDDGKVYVS